MMLFMQMDGLDYHTDKRWMINLWNGIAATNTISTQITKVQIVG
jgi:hypothetical protein